MKFGICTKVENAAAVKAAGWDYVEESVQGLLKGQTPDAEWDGLKRTTGAALSVPAANSLVPGSLPITEPNVTEDALTAYITNVLDRAKKIGIKTLVFGSAAARNVPDGFSRDKAREQIIRFLKNSVVIAKKNDVTLVAEPLNRGESNII